MFLVHLLWLLWHDTSLCLILYVSDLLCLCWVFLFLFSPFNYRFVQRSLLFPFNHALGNPFIIILVIHFIFRPPNSTPEVFEFYTFENFPVARRSHLELKMPFSQVIFKSLSFKDACSLLFKMAYSRTNNLTCDNASSIKQKCSCL